MPFNLLMTHCLVNGTSWNDSSTSPKISFEPKSNEKIFFFSIDVDKEVDPRYQFRKHYNLVNENICDLIIYYINFKEGRRLLLFTEIKGKDLNHAHKQLETTYNAVINHGDFDDFCKSGCSARVSVGLFAVSDRIQTSNLNSIHKKWKRCIKQSSKYKGSTPEIIDIHPKNFEAAIRQLAQ